jgi:hypothetical protein
MELDSLDFVNDILPKMKNPDLFQRKLIIFFSKSLAKYVDIPLNKEYKKIENSQQHIADTIENSLKLAKWSADSRQKGKLTSLKFAFIEQCNSNGSYNDIFRIRAVREKDKSWSLTKMVDALKKFLKKIFLKT